MPTKIEALTNMFTSAGETGVLIKDIESNIEPNRASIYSLVSHLRARFRRENKDIRCRGDHYIIVTRPRRQPPKRLSKGKTALVLSELNKMPMTTEELSSATAMSKNCVYNVVHILKKKGFTIQSIDGKYHLKGSITHQLSITSTNPPDVLPAPQDVASMSCIDLLLKDAANLPSQGRTDFFELLEKSIFYRLGAEAQIRAHKMVTGLRNGVEAEVKVRTEAEIKARLQSISQ